MFVVARITRDRKEMGTVHAADISTLLRCDWKSIIRVDSQYFEYFRLLLAVRVKGRHDMAI